MDNRTGTSMFDPYYSRIEEMLYLGYTKRETYDYIEEYFQLFTSYRNFLRYIKVRNLEWFMPVVEEC